MKKLAAPNRYFRKAPPPTTTKNGVVAQATVTLSLVVTLPEWTNYASANATERQKWDEFVGKVKKHEEGHVDIARRGRTAILNALPSFGKNPQSLFANQRAVFQREYARIRNEQREYDKVHYDVDH